MSDVRGIRPGTADEPGTAGRPGIADGPGTAGRRFVDFPLKADIMEAGNFRDRKTGETRWIKAAGWLNMV